jgi:hypothetical protein
MVLNRFESSECEELNDTVILCLTIRGQKVKEKEKEKQQQKEKAFNPIVEKNLSIEND